MCAQSTNGLSERSAESRGRILDAALREFAANGLAGARTERIAEAAGVNKALLYYYFESKEKLYTTALETIVARVRESLMGALQFPHASAGERLLRAALHHFDRIWAQREFQNLMQQEMVRLHRGEPGHIHLIVEKAFAPTMGLYDAAAHEGIASGELIDVDRMSILFASLGANVFYFLSAPIWQIIANHDHFAPESLAARRKALLEFLGQAIFVDRQHGAELAARVLADSPMPAADIKDSWRMP